MPRTGGDIERCEGEPVLADRPTYGFDRISGRLPQAQHPYRRLVVLGQLIGPSATESPGLQGTVDEPRIDFCPLGQVLDRYRSTGHRESTLTG